MKLLMSVLFLTLSLSSFAQRAIPAMGGVAGGGMPGFEYLHCQGEIYTSNTKIEEVGINVQVTSEGMITDIFRLKDSKKIVKEKSVRKADHFGITYTGKKTKLEIPQIPSPTWGRGEVNVIVKIKGIKQSTIICNAFSPN